MADTTEELVKVQIGIINTMSDDIKAMRANIETEMQKVKESATKSKSAFANLGDEIKGSFINAVKGAIVAYAGFTVISKITGFLMDARKEAQEYASATNSLTFSIAGSTKELREQASVLGKKLLIDDAEIIKAQAMFSVYTKNIEAIKKATPAILDLAKAQGIDLASAAQQVGRALADDNGELGRYKIHIEGALGSTERLDSIIKGITSTMGGQAEAAILSADNIDKLKKAWKELKESAGQAGGISPAEEMYERNQKIMSDYLADLKNMNYAQQAARTDQYNDAKAFNDKYDELMKKARTNNANAALASQKEQYDKMISGTVALQKKLNELTVGGQVKNLQVERDEALAKLDINIDYENRKRVIIQTYGIKINELLKADAEKRKKDSDDANKIQEDLQKQILAVNYMFAEANINLLEDENEKKLQLFDLVANREIEAITNNETAKNLIIEKFALERNALVASLEKEKQDQNISASFAWAESEIMLKEDTAARELELFDLRAQQELEKYKGNTNAKELTEKKFANDRVTLQKKLGTEIEKTEKEKAFAAAGMIIGLGQQIIEKQHDNIVAYKVMAMAEAGMNTAVAATKALTATPWLPVNIVLMTGTIIAGLAQQAKIAKESFQFGTNYAGGGPSIVGERGKEIVNLPRGSQVMSNAEIRNSQPSNSVTINYYDKSGDLAGALRTEIRNGDANVFLSEIRERLAL
jgi:hypothetical protein